MLFVLSLGHFWYSEVTSVIFSNNLCNFENNPKKVLKPPKKSKTYKLNKNLKNSEKSKDLIEHLIIQKNHTQKYQKMSTTKNQKKLKIYIFFFY